MPGKIAVRMGSAKVGLADYGRGARWEVAGLSSWEERALMVGRRDLPWDSTLYTRFAVNSELGAAPAPSSWGDDDESEPLTFIGYRVIDEATDTNAPDGNATAR